MFKVFRIKEEHSAFLSDGGGIGSRGLASVRLHHASLFSLSLTVCLPLSLCSSLFFCCPPLHVYCISLYLSPSPPLFFVDSLFQSVTHSTLVCFPPSFFFSPWCTSLYLTRSHPSISSTPHCHYPFSFIIYPLLYLPHVSVSTCVFISPSYLSFPMEAHKADGYSNRL